MSEHTYDPNCPGCQDYEAELTEHSFPPYAAALLKAVEFAVDQARQFIGEGELARAFGLEVVDEDDVGNVKNGIVVDREGHPLYRRRAAP